MKCIINAGYESDDGYPDRWTVLAETEDEMMFKLKIELVKLIDSYYQKECGTIHFVIEEGVEE